MKEMELTILMPCLNESRSLAFCIRQAQNYIRTMGVCGEILVADNGSTDNSRQIAADCGARVEKVAARGYGNAIMGGIRASGGRYIVVGDWDGSYDFSECGLFLEKLREGYGLVVGNRYLGGMEKKSMAFWHRYVGVPVLSMIGRKRYGVDIGDFHCGLRGFDREKALALDLQCGGMEFATEQIGRFARAGERICEVPAKLYRDRRCGPSHLRTIPDGWRHLRLMFESEKTGKAG